MIGKIAYRKKRKMGGKNRKERKKERERKKKIKEMMSWLTDTLGWCPIKANGLSSAFFSFALQRAEIIPSGKWRQSISKRMNKLKRMNNKRVRTLEADGENKMPISRIGWRGTRQDIWRNKTLAQCSLHYTL